jgi:hypothetical protein
MKLDVGITQGTYWKGAQIPYWVYLAFVIFPITGALGADHLLLRSPLTALLKLISIVPTLGFWYFYDIAQALGERDIIEKYGIAIPVYGPLGIGAGIFINKDSTNLSPPDIARPWRFIAYALASFLFIVLPVNKLVVGDYYGLFAQMAMYIMFPLTFVAIGWGFYDTYRILLDTRGVFEKGPARVTPASWFMDPNFDRSYMGPDKAEVHEKKEGGIFSKLFWAATEIPLAFMKATRGAINVTQAATVGVVNEATKGVTDVITESTKTATDTIQGVDKVVTSVVDGTSGSVQKLSSVAEKVAGLIEKLPQVADRIESKLSNPAALVQAGGGSDPSASSTLVLFGVALLAFGGYVMYTMKKTLKKGIDREDDSPPESRAVRGTFKAGDSRG